MLLELHNPRKKQPPTSRSVTLCLPPGVKWLIPPQSSVPLSVVKEKQWPHLWAFSTSKPGFIHSVNQTFLDGTGLQAEYQPGTSPQASFSDIILSQELITIRNAAKHLFCCSHSFLLLWPYTPTTAVPSVLLASYKLAPLSTPKKPQQLPKPWAGSNHFKTLQYHHMVPPITAQCNAEGRESRDFISFPSTLAHSWRSPI